MTKPTPVLPSYCLSTQHLTCEGEIRSQVVLKSSFESSTFRILKNIPSGPEHKPKWNPLNSCRIHIYLLDIYIYLQGYLCPVG